MKRARSGRLAGILAGLAALATLAGAGEARAELLEWEATLTLQRSDFEVLGGSRQTIATSRGFAVVNGSAGAAGLPLDTLSLAVSEAELATSRSKELPGGTYAGLYGVRMGSGVLRGFSQGALTSARLPIYAPAPPVLGPVWLAYGPFAEPPFWSLTYWAWFSLPATTNGGRTGFGLGGASVARGKGIGSPPTSASPGSPCSARRGRSAAPRSRAAPPTGSPFAASLGSCTVRRPPPRCRL